MPPFKKVSTKKWQGKREHEPSVSVFSYHERKSYQDKPAKYDMR